MNDAQQGNKRKPAEDAAAYAGPERRQELLQWRQNVDQRLDDGAATMRSLRADIATNTAVTQSIQTDTSELVALLNSFKGAFTVLEKLGKLAKPLGYIVGCLTAVGTLIAMVKGGGAPPK